MHSNHEQKPGYGPGRSSQVRARVQRSGVRVRVRGQGQGVKRASYVSGHKLLSVVDVRDGRFTLRYIVVVLDVGAEAKLVCREAATNSVTMETGQCVAMATGG